MLSTNPTRHRCLGCRIVGVLLLALLMALLMAQWSALGHAIAHGTVVSWVSASRVVNAGHGEHRTWGHEAGAPECRLFKQLLSTYALAADAAPTPGLPLASMPVAANNLSVCHQPRLRAYLARGPPRA